jgi:dephospho-CoA kinase
MKVIGLTGGIGMGKSTCAELLRARGVPVVDTDELARRVVEPGEAALAEVVRLFGAEILGHDGRLRRDELARRAFSDPDARKKLEQILHPRIASLWRAQVETWRQQGRPLAVVVIPLLFETHAERQLDATICVACSVPTQRERLLARKWPPEQIQQRIDAQLPAEEKIARSNYVIWTEGGLDLHEEQLNRILERISPS